MTNYRGIIPRGIPADHATAYPLQLHVRTLVDYDPDRMTDRVISDLFVGQYPTGIFAKLMVTDGEFRRLKPRGLMERHGPELERELVHQLTRPHAAELADLQIAIADLQAYIDRPRWWQICRLWNARRAA